MATFKIIESSVSIRIWNRIWTITSRNRSLFVTQKRIKWPPICFVNTNWCSSKMQSKFMEKKSYWIIAILFHSLQTNRIPEKWNGGGAKIDHDSLECFSFFYFFFFFSLVVYWDENKIPNRSIDYGYSIWFDSQKKNNSPLIWGKEVVENRGKLTKWTKKKSCIIVRRRQ